MASRRHRIDPDARSDGESWVYRPFGPSRHRRWIDSVPPAVGRKGHDCFVIAPRRGVQTLLRRDASHSRPLRPIVRSLVFRQSPAQRRSFFAVLIAALLLCGNAGCHHYYRPRAIQPPMTGLRPATPNDDVQAMVTPPIGWTPQPLKFSDRHTHQIWLSPTGDTAF